MSSSSEYIHQIAFCVGCGNEWDLVTIEWPPVVAICPGCESLLGLVGVDKESGISTYKLL